MPAADSTQDAGYIVQQIAVSQIFKPFIDCTFEYLIVFAT